MEVVKDCQEKEEQCKTKNNERRIGREAERVQVSRTECKQEKIKRKEKQSSFLSFKDLVGEKSQSN